jgi:ubiquinone/menaquinone biosynthesis C-methylase UbiE
MESLCDRYDIDEILDGFCGSAGLSRVALENDASHTTCIDLDLDCARKNLADVDNKVEFLEADIFDCTLPDRSYDIAVLDPYFDLIDEIFANRIDDILERADRVLLSAGFVSDRFWLDHIERQFSDHVSEVERYDNGRTVHLLGSE